MVTSLVAAREPEHSFSASTDPHMHGRLSPGLLRASPLSPSQPYAVGYFPSPSAALEPSCKLTVRSSLSESHNRPWKQREAGEMSVFQQLRRRGHGKEGASCWREHS